MGRSANGGRRYWTRMVAAQAASGLTREAFCEAYDLPVWRFLYWKYQKLPGVVRRLRSRGAPGSSSVSLVPVRVVHRGLHGVASVLPEAEVRGASTGSGVEVLLPRGLRVALRRGFDGAVLREVVEVLGC